MIAGEIIVKSPSVFLQEFHLIAIMPDPGRSASGSQGRALDKNIHMIMEY